MDDIIPIVTSNNLTTANKTQLLKLNKHVFHKIKNMAVICLILTPSGVDAASNKKGIQLQMLLEMPCLQKVTIILFCECVQ